MSRASRILAITTFLAAASLPVAVLAAGPLVEMEVVFAPGLDANLAAQKWTKALGDLGLASVRFRPLQNGDQTGIRTEGSGDTAVYQITALMNNHGALITPGGQFLLSDSARLKKWLEQVQSGGGQPGAKTVFGLSPKQFDEVKRALSAPVGFPTKGARPEQVIEHIRGMLMMPLAIDPTIAKSLAADDPVRDQLQGLSLGTALAAIARTAGGVLLPRAGRNGLELTLTAPQAGGEMWPIGWPPEVKDESKIVPKLFDFTRVDIDGVPASQAIDAIESRLGVPMLFDYNNMARQRVDLKKPVKVTAGQSYYRHILDRVLFQAGLKAEVRLDDAGNPFVWITTL
jgi:hypothetical protein